MAIKRKNNTRVDPFANDIQSSDLDQLLAQAQTGDVIAMPAPSDATRTINLVCKVIPYSEIEKQTTVFGKNRRVQDLLSEKSVADILPAIKNDGRNQHPALAWEKDTGLQILAGSRRRKACLLAKADYIVLSSPDFTEQDAKILAVSSDQYIAPSLWELGQAYVQTKDELLNANKKGSYREIAQIEGVSHTAVADAMKAYELLPQHVLTLYPTANHVGREVAKKLINAQQKDPAIFTQRVKQLQDNPALVAQQSDDKTALAITKFLCDQPTNASKREVLELGNQYITMQRHHSNGDISIKIDHQVLTEKRLTQLTKLLESFN